MCVCVCIYVTSRLSPRLLTLYTHFKSSIIPCIVSICYRTLLERDVALCRLINSYRHFDGSQCLQLQRQTFQELFLDLPL